MRSPTTRHATSSAIDDIPRDEILYLPVSSIDPDPDQPRLEVDAELADSIARHGVLQAIQVRPHPSGADDRWMIVDGERRWRGAVKAKVATIPATITLEVEDVGDRIIRQIVRNEGKPLTPAEEAIAFKRIIASKQLAGEKRYGTVHLAKELGIPKSTVSDRLAMMEIPPFWMPLIVEGPLQPSHVPLLHRWRKVPEKFQQKALEQMQADYRWAGHVENRAKKGDRIYVSVFKTLLETFMYKFIKPIADVPGYVGPTDTFEKRNGWPRKRLVHAMDPSKWQPIYRKAIASKRGKSAGKASATDTYQRDQERYRREQSKRDAEQKQWAAATPKIVAATAEAVTRAPVDRLADLILDRVSHYGRGIKAARELVPRGTDGEQFIRHAAMVILAQQASDNWSAPRDFPKVAKSLGIDLKKLLAGSGGNKDAEASEPDVDVNEYDIEEGDEQLECDYCGCTQLDACELDDGPCGWMSSEPPVCSNPSCVIAWQAAAEASEEFADALEPAVS